MKDHSNHNEDPAHNPLSGRNDLLADLRHVFALSIPMVVSMSSPLVMRVADFAFVSQLGIEAKAAIVPSQMLLWCYLAMCMGTVSAVSTFAAQSLGRKEPAACGSYAWQSVYLSAILGVLGFSLYFLLPWLFRLFDHGVEIQRLEILYSRISVLGIAPTILAVALGAFFNGVHRPRITMWSAVEANGLNVLLDYLLIFGIGGFPQMGFAGAAWATVAAGVYQSLRLMAMLISPSVHSEFSTRTMLRWDRSKLRQLMRVGMPQGIHMLSDVSVWALFSNLLIGRFGVVHLAASNVAWQYIRIGILPMLGMGQAITAAVGKAIGERNPDRAVRMTRLGIWIACGYVVPLSLVYAWLGSWLVSLFDSSPEVVALGSQIMMCVATFEVFDVVGISYNHALRGAGDTTWPMLFMVISHWTLVVGVGYLVAVLMPQWGSLGPWWVATALICIAGVGMWWRWNSGAWRKINLYADAG